jgi:hypothetical protein
MCVTNEANVLIYDIFGKLITQFGFVSVFIEDYRDAYKFRKSKKLEYWI